MFHTISYRGHYIQLSCLNNVEHIKAQIVSPDGGFDFINCKTFAGAQRAIAKHVSSIGNEK